MGVEIREVEPDDAEAVLEAWNLFRRGVDPARAQRGPEEWRWAHEHNPAGRRAVAAFADGRVVAHYAALPHVVWMNAGEQRFAEVVDSFVLPEHRRGLAREGLYVRLARELLDAHAGPGGDTVIYGWPTRAEWRLGRKLLGYEIVRTQTVLVRESGTGSGEPPDGVETILRFDHQVRWLWDRCSDAFGASVIRDESFLNWRFVERPGHRYVVLGVRDDSRVLRGYAVYRRAVWPREEAGLIVDWLVPPDELDVAELLLRAILHRAHADGVGRVSTVLPEWSPWFDVFQRWGFLVLDAERVLFARTTARRFDDVWLRENWWSTLADSVEV